MESKSRQSTFAPAVLLMAGRVSAFVATFFIPVVLVRVFSQAEFGTYKQIFLLFSTLYCIGQLGMAESLFYFIPAAPGAGGRYIANALLILLGAGLVCIAALAALRRPISSLLSNAALAQYLPLLGLYLLFMLASAVLEIVMISYKQHLLASISYAVSDIVRAVFVVLPVLFFPGLQYLLFGAVLFAALRFALTQLYLNRQFGPRPHLDGSLLHSQLAYTVPFEAAIIAETLQANLHQYVVSHGFDAATFAIYSVGCLQVPIVDFIANPTSNVMMVRMREELRDGRNDLALEVWRDLTGKLALIFFPMFALLVVSAHHLITLLFTSAYAASVPVFMAWSVTIALAALQTDGVMRAYGETRFLLLLAVVKLIFIAAFIQFFLSHFYLLGAVAVTVLAVVIAKAGSLIRMRKIMSAGMQQLLPWGRLARISAVSAAAALPAVLVGWKLQLPAIPELIAIGAVYSSAYLALVWLLGLLSEDERAALVDWVQMSAARAVKLAEFKKG